MKKACLVSMVALLFTMAFGVMGASAGNTLDFNAYKTTGAVEWAVEAVGNEMQVVQKKADGGAGQFAFDVTMPQDYVFEAELGCIGGNNATARPYFGLLFNYVDDTNTYRFLFRPSSGQYQLHRVAGASETIGSFADAAPWAWELKEWRTLRIVRKGKLMEAYVNDKLIMSVEDDKLSGGTVGFYTFSTSAVMRKISLKAL